jgi:hypothetical protein
VVVSFTDLEPPLEPPLLKEGLQLRPEHLLLNLRGAWHVCTQGPCQTLLLCNPK